MYVDISELPNGDLPKRLSEINCAEAWPGIDAPTVSKPIRGPYRRCWECRYVAVYYRKFKVVGVTNKEVRRLFSHGECRAAAVLVENFRIIGSFPVFSLSGVAVFRYQV